MSSPLERPYPGRGIVAGLGQDGVTAVHVYWITGRSPNSRNRLLAFEDGVVRTTVADASQSHDPTYTIYTAIQRCARGTVVANGDHGDAIAHRLGSGTAPGEVFSDVAHEDDPPIFTPRITAVTVNRDGRLECVLSKVSRLEELQGSLRSHYRFTPRPGAGLGIQTYDGDVAHPAVYGEDPFPVALTGGAERLADEFWGRLDPSYRVCLAVWTQQTAGGPPSVVLRNANG